MNRTEKSAEIELLKEKFAKSQLMVLTDYKGLKVNEINELRQKLRSVQAEMKVVKNRLAKLALKGTGSDDLISKFVGTTAVTLSGDDLVGPAKVLTAFAKEHEALSFKTAVMQGKALSKADLQALANLPSREELIAKLLGSLQAPARNWVSVLAQIPRSLVNVLAAVRDSKEKQG